MSIALSEHLPLLATAPESTRKLRGLILELAVRGKLVPQDPNDEPASELLKRIAEERARLEAEGICGKLKRLAPVCEEEQPFSLPNSWAWVRFSDVTSYIQRGKGPEYADRSVYVVVSQKCVRWSGLDLAPARFITPESFSKYDPVRLLRRGDILWNSTGTGTIGRAVVVPETIPNQTLVADSHVTVVRSVVTNPTFMWRWIQSPSVQSEIEGSASGSTNQIELATSTVTSHLLPLPPLAEQHRIVAKVDELMALCDRLEAEQSDAAAAHERLIATLLGTLTQSSDAADLAASWQRLAEHFDTLFTTEASLDALKQTILQLAVMGKLVPQDPDDEPASELLKQIALERSRLEAEGACKKSKPMQPVGKENHPFPLPKGWSCVHFNEIVNPEKPISYGVLVPGPDVSDGVPFVRIADLSITNPSALPQKTIDRSVDAQFARTQLEGGEILMGVVGSIGKLGVAPMSWKGANIARAICRIVPTPHFDKSFLVLLLQSKVMQMVFTGDTRTLAQPTLNVGLIRTAHTPIPPLAEQHRIVAKVDELLSLVDRLKAGLADSRAQQERLATILIETALKAA